MKKNDFHLAVLLVTGVFMILSALIFDTTQNATTLISVVVVLVVLIVVIGVDDKNGQASKIATVFNSIGTSIAQVIRAINNKSTPEQ